MVGLPFIPFDFLLTKKKPFLKYEIHRRQVIVCAYEKNSPPNLTGLFDPYAFRARVRATGERARPAGWSDLGSGRRP